MKAKHAEEQKINDIGFSSDENNAGNERLVSYQTIHAVTESSGTSKELLLNSKAVIIDDQLRQFEEILNKLKETRCETITERDEETKEEIKEETKDDRPEIKDPPYSTIQTA